MRADKELIKKMTLQEKVKYFLEYYSGRTVIITIFLVLTVYSIYSYVSKERPDFNVLYAGEQVIESNKTAKVESAFIPFITDKNNDGKKIVSLINISMDINSSQYNDVINHRILAETTTGKALFYILSPKKFNEFKNSSLIADISDINEVKDKLSIPIKDTKLKGMEFPDDYVVCLRKPFASATAKSQKRNEADFEFAKDILKQISR